MDIPRLRSQDHMTLGDLVYRLRELHPGVMVHLGDAVYSYRGDYRQACLEPKAPGMEAHQLADELEAQFGSEREGWKGGMFVMGSGTYVYVVEWGSTGPMLIGIDWDGTVVTCQEGY